VSAVAFLVSFADFSKLVPLRKRFSVNLIDAADVVSCTAIREGDDFFVAGRGSKRSWIQGETKREHQKARKHRNYSSIG
jgi:hypothetical protein